MMIMAQRGFAFEDRDCRLLTNAQHPTNEVVLGKSGGGREIHENIRPETPLVELDPQLLAEPTPGLERE